MVGGWLDGWFDGWLIVSRSLISWLVGRCWLVVGCFAPCQTLFST